MRAPLHGWSWLVVVLAVTAAAYGAGLGYGYVYDDAILVEGSRIRGALGDVPRLLTWELWASTDLGVHEDSGYYRPLFLLSLWADRLLPEAAWPVAHHAQSLGWHLGVVALVGVLARRLGASSLSVGIGAAVAALHPAQVATVQFIAARNDAMATALGLGACVLVTGARLGPPALAGVAALSALAVLSKESAALLPLVVALVVAVPTARRRTAPLAAGGASAAGVAVAALARVGAGVGLPDGVTVDAVAGVSGTALVHWLDVLGWPVGLVPEASSIWPTPPSVAGVGIGFVVLAAVLVGGGAAGRVALACAALVTAPALAAVASVGHLPDRYLYGALAFGGVAVAVAADRIPFRARVGVGGFLLASFTVLTATTLPVWQSDLDLWRAGTQRHPQPHTWSAYGKTLELAGLLDEAAVYTGLAATGHPPVAHACFNAASIHLKRGAPADAAAAGLAALEAGCAPSPELLAPTAIGLAVTGRWREAEELARAVGSDPTGQAVLVRCAAAARRGDLTTLAATAAAGGGDPRALKGQVAWLLRQGGEEAAALAVEAAPL